MGMTRRPPGASCASSSSGTSAGSEPHIGDADLAQVRFGALQQGLDALDGEDLRHQPSQYGRLVTAARTDLEHTAHRCARPQCLGHKRDDVRL
jgi:hypothetical protein